MDKDQKKIGIILSYISIAVNVAVQFMYVPILIHYMGKSEYGLYQLMGSLIASLVVLDFGLPATVIRYYSKYKALNDKTNMENVLALCSRIYIVITAMIVVVGIVLYFFLDNIFSNSLTASELESAKAIYIICIINLFITLPTQIFGAIITSHEKFIFLKLISIIPIILQPVVVILLMRVSPYALTLVIIQTAFNAFVVAAKIYYCFAKIKVKIKLHYFDKQLFWSIMRYSFFIFLNVIVEQIFWRSNQIILGVVATTAVVAVYSIAYQISYNYMSLSTVISGVFLPSVTSMVSKGTNNKELSNLFIKVGRLQFMLLFCALSGFFLFGRQFIYVWAGDGFQDAYLMTLLLIVPFTVDLIQNIGLTILQAQNKFYFKVLVFLGIAIVNVALAIPMAQRFGGVGCALVTGLTFFIGNAIIMNIFYYKNIGLDIRKFWWEITKIFIPCALCCAFGFILNLFSISNIILDLIVKIVIYIVVYMIVLRLFVLNSYEINLIKTPINNIKRKFVRN